MSATYLDRIVAAHRASASDDPRSVEQLIDEARSAAPARGFTSALRSVPEGDLAVIAEVKRRSPSKGDLAADLDPAERSEEHTSELQSLMRTSYAVFCLKKEIEVDRTQRRLYKNGTDHQMG